MHSPAGVASKCHFFHGTPEMESRSCPETVPVGVPGLWDFRAPRSSLRSERGLNQSCSPQKELSNAVLHSWSARREQVDSRLLVVGSQTANLTPGPSFAHNLGFRCPNDQCEAIFDIYVLRPFQWHQERLNARCFGPCCRALNIRESRRTPNPQPFQVLGFTPTLGQSGVATFRVSLGLNYKPLSATGSKKRLFMGVSEFNWTQRHVWFIIWGVHLNQ
jgi:hypothetical protein